MKSDILRERFLEFFHSKGHRILPSDSLVPREDPTVLFTSAGMNQFKKQFLGQNVISPRVATCQKCLRTDDLDKVGKTAGHHTFFEMLGNFSFGDYFKIEAIEWAWEFMTKELQIPADRLWVSVYKDDHQACKIWKEKIKIPQGRIVELGDKENFWPSEAKEKGPNGPCGPCSEIFFDQGKDIGCGSSNCNPACDCDRFVEVWNLVFTQFERREGGVLVELPKKNIDTGMGLERLAAVMQGVLSNFQTDLFLPILKTVEEIAHIKLNKSNKEAFYAISDHIRAITFAISDGIIPSNEARGYVIRNLIRRSLQQGRALGVKKVFLYKLIPSVSSVMKRAYPELERKREDIAQIVKAEEEKCLEMLDETLPKFKEVLETLVQENKQQVPADIVFKFRDTYGLPWDIIETTASSSGLNIDWVKVEELLELQRSRSRDQSKISDSIFTKTHIFKGKSIFLRDTPELETVVVDLFRKEDSQEVEVVLEKTPFYPEAGGQIGDSGVLINKNIRVAIHDTKKIGEAIVHYGKIEEGCLNIGDKVLACYDKKRRLNIARNHTATHLLQAALRKVLGEHVQQQGSLVSDERLRFDFTHYKSLTKQELDRIEEVVNSYIKNNDGVKTEEMSLDKARESGALAFFAEKYEDKVRVVSVGNYSKELCGGTHLESTRGMGLFKIIASESVAQGIRRIEAVTADFAYEKLREEEENLHKISAMLGVPQDRIAVAINNLFSHLKELEKKLSLIQGQLLRSSLDKLLKETQVINEKNVILKFMPDYDADSLRKIVDLIKQKSSNSIILLTTLINNKVFLVLGVTEDLVKKAYDASKIIKEISSTIGFSGAGRPDFAQAGGGDSSKIKDIEEALKKIIKTAV